MKKIFYIVEILIFIIILNPFSCTNNITTAWTVSGTTIFNGTPPVGTPIKLAGFFTYSGQTDPRYLVSNIATATNGGYFSLDIDASSIDPDDLAKIYLLMWDDDNNNGSKDPDERTYSTVPASGGCPVFGKYGFCVFEYHADESGGCLTLSDEYDKGWNVEQRYVQEGDEGYSCTSESKSVNIVALAGARITNSSSF